MNSALLKCGRSQLLRFAAVGTVTAVMYLSVALFAAEAVGLNIFRSSVAGLLCCTVFQYFAHAKLTFKTGSLEIRQVLKFLIIVVAGMVISYTASAMTHRYEGARYMTFGVVIVAMPIFNYVFFKIWVYRRDVSS